jgi:alpha-amylase
LESTSPDHLQASASGSIIHFKMLLLNLITTLLFWVTSIVSAADTSAWKSRNIYFVLTDRIARSSSDAGGGQCSDLGNYCGGTFNGLESKLDYIKGLGFDAIWITPVVSSKFRAVYPRR